MQRIRLYKFVLGLLFLTISVIFLFTSNYLQVDFAEESSEESNSKLDDEFLVNTFGCKMSRFPVMTPKIQEFFVPPEPIVCSPPAITESDECKQ